MGKIRLFGAVLGILAVIGVIIAAEPVMPVSAQAGGQIDPPEGGVSGQAGNPTRMTFTSISATSVIATIRISPFNDASQAAYLRYRTAAVGSSNAGSWQRTGCAISSCQKGIVPRATSVDFRIDNLTASTVYDVQVTTLATGSPGSPVWTGLRQTTGIVVTAPGAAPGTSDWATGGTLYAFYYGSATPNSQFNLPATGYVRWTSPTVHQPTMTSITGSNVRQTYAGAIGPGNRLWVWLRDRSDSSSSRRLSVVENLSSGTLRDVSLPTPLPTQGFQYMAWHNGSLYGFDVSGNVWLLTISNRESSTARRLTSVAGRGQLYYTPPTIHSGTRLTFAGAASHQGALYMLGYYQTSASARVAQLSAVDISTRIISHIGSAQGGLGLNDVLTGLVSDGNYLYTFNRNTRRIIRINPTTGAMTNATAAATRTVYNGLGFTLPSNPSVSSVSGSYQSASGNSIITVSLLRNTASRNVYIRYRALGVASWTTATLSTSNNAATSSALALARGRDYEIQASLDNAFPSDGRVTAEYTPTPIGPTVGGFRYSSIQETGVTVTVSINGSSGLTQTVYLRLRVGNSGQWQTFTRPKTRSASTVVFNLSQLTGSTTYNLQSALQSGFTTRVADGQFTTMTGTLRVGTPVVSATTGTTATVTVPVLNGRGQTRIVYLRYRLAAQTPPAGWTNLSRSESAAAVPFPLSGLTAGSNYEVQASLSSAFTGATTAALTTTAPPAAPSVSNIAVDNILRDSARGTVTIANRRAGQQVTVYYRYRTTPSGSYTNGTVRAVADTAIFNLLTLTPGTAYEVEASTDSGYSPSETYTFTTESVPQGETVVATVRAGNIGHNTVSILVTIANPDGGTHRVRLFYRESMLTSGAYSTAYGDTDQVSLIIPLTNLIAEKTYLLYATLETALPSDPDNSDKVAVTTFSTDSTPRFRVEPNVSVRLTPNPAGENFGPGVARQYTVEGSEEFFPVVIRTNTQDLNISLAEGQPAICLRQSNAETGPSLGVGIRDIEPAARLWILGCGTGYGNSILEVLEKGGERRVVASYLINYTGVGAEITPVNFPDPELGGPMIPQGADSLGLWQFAASIMTIGGMSGSASGIINLLGFIWPLGLAGALLAGMHRFTGNISTMGIVLGVLICFIGWAASVYYLGLTPLVISIPLFLLILSGLGYGGLKVKGAIK